MLDSSIHDKSQALAARALETPTVAAWRVLIDHLVASSQLELSAVAIDLAALELGREWALEQRQALLNLHHLAKRDPLDPRQAQALPGGLALPVAQGWLWLDQNGQRQSIHAHELAWLSPNQWLARSEDGELWQIVNGHKNSLAQSYCRGLYGLGGELAWLALFEAPALSPNNYFWRPGSLRLIHGLSVDPYWDLAPWAGGAACIRGGIQAHEVRFIEASGGWRARLSHEAPLRAIWASPESRVETLDREGRLLRWNSQGRVCHAEQVPGLSPLSSRSRWRGCRLGALLVLEDFTEQRIFAQGQWIDGIGALPRGEGAWLPLGVGQEWALFDPQQGRILAPWRPSVALMTPQALRPYPPLQAWHQAWWRRDWRRCQALLSGLDKLCPWFFMALPPPAWLGAEGPPT